MEKSEFVSTPMLRKPKLDEDKQGKPVYATIYRNMIGSLMYLTSSKLDIHFDTSCVPVTNQGQRKSTLLP